MSKPRALTHEQHRQLADRHFLYVRLRLEAAKHSIPTLARELGVHQATVRDYLNRPLREFP